MPNPPYRPPSSQSPAGKQTTAPHEHDYQRTAYFQSRGEVTRGR